MFWLGLVVGLLVGAPAGVMAICWVSMNRHTELCEALDLCRCELSFVAYANGDAARACANATRVLNENGWMASGRE